MNEQKTETPKQTSAARIADRLERMVELLRGELADLHVISADSYVWGGDSIQVGEQGFTGDEVKPHGEGNYLEVSKTINGIKVLALTESLSPETLALLNQAAKVKLGDV